MEQNWLLTSAMLSQGLIRLVQSLYGSYKSGIYSQKLFCPCLLNISGHDSYPMFWILKFTSIMTMSKYYYVTCMYTVNLWSMQMTLWVTREILSLDSLKQRCTVIQKMLDICKTCLKLNNYVTLFQITSALISTPVQRLRKTWDLLPPNVGPWIILFACQWHVHASVHNFPIKQWSSTYMYMQLVRLSAHVDALS